MEIRRSYIIKMVLFFQVVCVEQEEQRVKDSIWKNIKIKRVLRIKMLRGKFIYRIICGSIFGYRIQKKFLLLDLYIC